MKVSVIKTASGALIPASEIDFDLMKKSNLEKQFLLK